MRWAILKWRHQKLSSSLVNQRFVLFFWTYYVVKSVRTCCQVQTYSCVLNTPTEKLWWRDVGLKCLSCECKVKLQQCPYIGWGILKVKAMVVCWCFHMVAGARFGEPVKHWFPACELPQLREQLHKELDGERTGPVEGLSVTQEQGGSSSRKDRQALEP